MHSSQLENKVDEQEMVPMNLMDCLNNPGVIKHLIHTHAIFFDWPIGNETLLSYIEKSPSASREVYKLFLAQQQHVEKILPELPNILSNIINQPISIDETDVKLYQNCSSLNDGLRKLVISNKIALLSMKQKNSLLRQILPQLNCEDSLARLNKQDAALQKNDIFMSSVIGFNDKKLLDAAKDPEFIKRRMQLIGEEKKDQSLAQKLVNYASTYCVFAPDRILFKDQPEFVAACKEKVKQLSGEVLQFLHTLKGKSTERLDYYKTIITCAYEDVDSGFLLQCLTLFDKLRNPTNADKINMAAWKAVAQDDVDNLSDIVLHKELDLSYPNPMKNDSEETLLHYAIFLGHVRSTSIILQYIIRNKLYALCSVKTRVAEEKNPLNPAELAFKLISSPILGAISRNHLWCFKLLLSLTSEKTAECEKILLEGLKTFGNPESDVAIKELLKSAAIGAYHCTFAIKFPHTKCFVVQPDTPLYQYLVENKKDVHAIIERDKVIIQKVMDDKLQPNEVDLDDLKIKDQLGKTLIDIAAEMKSERAIQILKTKKKQQGFAHQLQTLDGLGLYQLIMGGKLDLEMDKNFLEFFASDHDIAKKARTTLIRWILDNVNNFLFIKTVKNDFDYVIQVFSTIFQNDNTITQEGSLEIGGKLCGRLDALLQGIKGAKAIADEAIQECKKADEIFSAIIANRLSDKEITNYSHNLDLLTLFKKKIMETENLSVKLTYYERLFWNDDDGELPPHQLYKVFHMKKSFTKYEHEEYNNLLCQLIEDQKQTIAFVNGIEKLKQKKAKKPGFFAEQNVIPLATLPKKDYSQEHKNGLQPDKASSQLSLATQTPEPNTSSGKQEARDLDEQSRTAKLF